MTMYVLGKLAFLTLNLLFCTEHTISNLLRERSSKYKMCFLFICDVLRVSYKGEALMYLHIAVYTYSFKLETFCVIRQLFKG